MCIACGVANDYATRIFVSQDLAILRLMLNLRLYSEAARALSIIGLDTMFGYGLG